MFQLGETIALSQDLVVTPPDLNDMEEWYLPDSSYYLISL
jgi:hypothetical protein